MSVRGRLGGRRGSEFVEGMLMLPFFLALVFLLVDAAYGLYIQAALQYAVQAGAAYAAAYNGTALGAAATVQQPSRGLNQANYQSVTVSYCVASDNCSTSPQPEDVVVVVSASYLFTPLAPLFRSAAAITLNARATSPLSGSTL